MTSYVDSSRGYGYLKAYKSETFIFEDYEPGVVNFVFSVWWYWWDTLNVRVLSDGVEVANSNMGMQAHGYHPQGFWDGTWTHGLGQPTQDASQNRNPEPLSVTHTGGDLVLEMNNISNHSFGCAVAEFQNVTLAPDNPVDSPTITNVADGAGGTYTYENWPRYYFGGNPSIYVPYWDSLNGYADPYWRQCGIGGFGGWVANPIDDGFGALFLQGETEPLIRAGWVDLGNRAPNPDAPASILYIKTADKGYMPFACFMPY